MDYDKSVYRVLMKVPRGKVTTYKMIACALGKPLSFRAVGSALGRNPNLDNVPCYRVIKSDGSIGGYRGGILEKIRRLRADGINIKDGMILDLEKKLFTPKPLKRP